MPVAPAAGPYPAVNRQGLVAAAQQAGAPPRPQNGAALQQRQQSPQMMAPTGSPQPGPPQPGGMFGDALRRQGGGSSFGQLLGMAHQGLGAEGRQRMVAQQNGMDGISQRGQATSNLMSQSGYGPGPAPQPGGQAQEASRMMAQMAASPQSGALPAPQAMSPPGQQSPSHVPPGQGPAPPPLSASPSGPYVSNRVNPPLLPSQTPPGFPTPFEQSAPLIATARGPLPDRQPFGTAGTPVRDADGRQRVNAQGFGIFEPGTEEGFIGQQTARATNAVGMDAADRQNILDSASIGEVAQGAWHRGEQQQRNMFDAIGQLLGARTPQLINDNAAFGQRILDQHYGNMNTFRGDADQRQAETLAAQQAAVRGYGNRTDDISNTLRNVDASMSRRQGHLRTAQDDLQRRQGTNQVNRLGEQGALDTRYGDRVGEIMSLLNLRGREALSDINRKASRASNQSSSDLASRGMYNTTVTDAARRGIEEDRSREERGLGEQLREQELGLLQTLSREELENLRQTSATRNDLAQQVIGQSDRNLVRQQQAHMDTAQRQADTALARGGLQGEGLQAQERGVDFRQQYNAPLMAQMAQMLDRTTQTGEAQRATATALASDQLGTEYGYLGDEKLRQAANSPTFNQLLNMVLQAGTDSPVPIQPAPSQGTLTGGGY